VDAAGARANAYGDRVQPVEVPAGRLLLRPFRPSDAPAVLAACQDAAIQRWTTAPSPYSEGDAVAFLTEIAPAEWAADTDTPFAISGAATGRLLGSIGVHRVDRRHGSAEVGYWVAAAASGRGVATEALRAVTSWSFAALGLGRLELLHAVGNGASCRVASRAGFRPEGVLRGRVVVSGARADAEIHGRLAADGPTD